MEATTHIVVGIRNGGGFLHFLNPLQNIVVSCIGAAAGGRIVRHRVATASSKGSENASVASDSSVAGAVARVTDAVTRGTTPTQRPPTSTPTVAGDLGGVAVWYYEGEWQHNVRVGHGLLFFTDHSYYRGEFQRDQFWGKGVYVHPLSQTQYEGMWRANMRHGMGTSLEPDGSIYTGEYFSNMKQGDGKLMRPDGSVYLGTWDANTIVGMG
eukprot:gene31592-40679_t